MENYELIEWMKDHSPRYAVVLGVEGYKRTPEYDQFFIKEYTDYFAKRVALMVVLLMSEEEARVYLNGEKYNFKKKGLKKLVKKIKKVLKDDDQILEIFFTRRIIDLVKRPELERTYEYFLTIDDLTSTSFYHIPPQRKKYIAKLVGKVNLGLKKMPLKDQDELEKD